ELYADKAIEFLGRPERRQRPFFLYVSFNAPHDPRQSPRRFLDLYPPDRIGLPPSYLPEHPFDQGDKRIRDERLAPFPRTPEAVRLHRAEYYAIITHFDVQIGRILDALEAHGLADNTYVLCSSDHGLAVGQHGLMGKQNQYDHSIRMPLILCGPGLTPGRRIHQLVYLHSLYATTCELAAIPLPETVEFPSLSPLLTGRSESPVHDAVFGSYRHFQRMVRTQEWKLIVYPVAGRTQLFDLRADPWETTDLSARPETEETMERLRRKLRQLQAEVGDDLDLDGPLSTGGPRRPGTPVTADAEGVLRLTPETASVAGALRYQPDKGNLGAWFHAADTPRWLLRGVKAGTYRISFAYGCTNPGIGFTVRCGTGSVRGVTQATGGMRTYAAVEVGTVVLPAGDVAVEVVPDSFRGALMNVRGLTLTPAP
ncbi:MAG: sulfatase-like hydrolase/transferase, partial [Lentisphaeria bacterium]|nr:sulfatase-like hydrolase/transferase [Lentisphaeria bacterium]